MDVDFQVIDMDHYVQILPVGSVKNGKEYSELQLRYFDIIQDHPSLSALIDVRDLKFPNKISDQVLVMNHNEVQLDLNLARKFKIALVIDPSLRDAGEFYESLSFSMGLTIQLFEEADAAKTWLKS